MRATIGDQEGVLAGHRVGRRSDAPTPVAGKRKAVKRPRPAHARFLPSVPTIIGAVALVVAAAGAVTIGSGSVETAAAAGPIDRLAGQANVLNGVSDVYSSNPDHARTMTTSRASTRVAATEAELHALAATRAQSREAALAELSDRANSYAEEVAKNSWTIPIEPGAYRVSGHFGECNSLWTRCHSGLDLAAPSGTPIVAIARGTVVSAQYAGACGNRIVQRLENGTELWYCHQRSFSTHVGAVLNPGDPVGYVGSTGRSTGPHLHIEVHPGGGDGVDPLAAFRAHGVDPVALARSTD